jgi:hypothetical protein
MAEALAGQHTLKAILPKFTGRAHLEDCASLVAELKGKSLCHSKTGNICPTAYSEAIQVKEITFITEP